MGLFVHNNLGEASNSGTVCERSMKQVLGYVNDGSAVIDPGERIEGTQVTLNVCREILPTDTSLYPVFLWFPDDLSRSRNYWLREPIDALHDVVIALSCGHRDCLIQCLPYS